MSIKAQSRAPDGDKHCRYGMDNRDTRTSGLPAVHMVVVDPEIRRSNCRLLRAFRIACIEYDDPEAFLQAYDQQSGCLTIDLQGHELRAQDFLLQIRGAGIGIPAIVMDPGFRFSERQAIESVRPQTMLLAKPADPIIYIRKIRRLIASSGSVLRTDQSSNNRRDLRN